MKKTSTRKSNIELLRIVATLLIVAHHFSAHGVFVSSEVVVNKIWLDLMLFGNIGVNMFVLISGYFLINSTELKLTKLLKLWLQIVSYSLGLYLIYVSVSLDEFSIGGLIKHLMPICNSQWWFASSYFILFLLSPFLGMMFKSLSKSNYQKMLLTMCVLWSILPTLSGMQVQSNFLWWFAFVFALGGYIRLYNPLSDWHNKKLYAITSIVIVLCYLSVIAFDIIGTRISWFDRHAARHIGLQMFPTIVAASLLFLSFLRLNIKDSKIINTISSCTFGVYLLHDYPTSGGLIWEKLFNNNAYVNSPYLIPYSLLVVILVFVACTIIEWLRIIILENQYMKIINSVFAKKDVTQR